MSDRLGPSGYGAGRMAQSAGMLHDNLASIFARREQHDAEIDQQELIRAQRELNTAYNNWLANNADNRWDRIEGSYEGFSQGMDGAFDELFSDDDTRERFNTWMQETLSANRVKVANIAAEARQGYRQGLFEDNLESAINTGDMEALVDVAISAGEDGLIPDYKVDDTIATGAYSINLGTVKSTIFGYAEQNGWEAARAELDSMPAESFQYVSGYKEDGTPIVSQLSRDDINAIKGEVRDELDVLRDEQKYQREERNRTRYEQLSADFEERPLLGLNALRNPEVIEDLDARTLEHLKDRWTNDLIVEEEEEETGDGFVDTATMLQNFEEVRRWILETQPDFSAVEQRLSEYLLPGELLGLNHSFLTELRKMANNPTGDPTTLPVNRMIDSALEEFSEVLSPSQISTARFELVKQIATFQRMDDGTPRTDAEMMEQIRIAARNIAEPEKLKNINAIGSELETLFRNPLFRGFDNFEDVRQQINNDRAMVGILIQEGMQTAVQSGLADPEFIRDVMVRERFGNRTYDSLDKREQQIIDNNVNAAMVNIDAAALYRQFTGTDPTRNIVTMPDGSTVLRDVYFMQDGSVAFRGPDGKLVQPRVDPDKKDERWYEFSGGTWTEADYMHEAVREDVQPAPIEEISSAVHARRLANLEEALAAPQRPDIETGEVVNEAMVELDELILSSNPAITAGTRRRLQTIRERLERDGEINSSDQMFIDSLLRRVEARR